MELRVGSAAPADTSPEVWRRQMAALGALSPRQRLDLWEELNTQLADLEERAVRRQHPGFDDREVLIELVRRRYGGELVDAVWPDQAGAAS